METILKQQGLDLESSSLHQMEDAWQQAKAAEH
jgi:uncharacterized protein YabN with tetrapyrrole methylase and pyrophosphatase domain